MPDDTMPESAPEQAVESAPAPDVAPAEDADTFKSEHSKQAVLGDLAREREARKALEARVKEFEDRDKTEAERVAERLAAAEQEAAQARREAARYRVASAKGVDPELLSGDDEEQMAAHADRLLAWRGDVKPPAPRPDPGQGARPVTPEAQLEAEYAQFYPTS